MCFQLLTKCCEWRCRLYVGRQTGIVRVWVAGKTEWSRCYTRAISERFRDKGLIIRCYINSSVHLHVWFNNNNNNDNNNKVSVCRYLSWLLWVWLLAPVMYRVEHYTLLLLLLKCTYQSDAMVNIDNVKKDLEQTNYNFNQSKELVQDRQWDSVGKHLYSPIVKNQMTDGGREERRQRLKMQQQHLMQQSCTLYTEVWSIDLSHAFIHDLNSKILTPAISTELVSTHQTSQILHRRTIININKMTKAISGSIQGIGDSIYACIRLLSANSLMLEMSHTCTYRLMTKITPC